MTGLYGHNAFSVLVLSTKKWCANFFTNVFIIQRNCCKVKVLKTIKISSHDFENSYYCFLEKPMLFLLALNETSKKKLFPLLTVKRLDGEFGSVVFPKICISEKG